MARAPSRGSTVPRLVPYLICGAARLALTAGSQGTHSTVSRQVRSKVRGPLGS